MSSSQPKSTEHVADDGASASFAESSTSVSPRGVIFPSHPVYTLVEHYQSPMPQTPLTPSTPPVNSAENAGYHYPLPDVLGGGGQFSSRPTTADSPNYNSVPPTRSAVNSVTGSLAELPRVSSSVSHFSSRPTTADSPISSSVRMSTGGRMREAFTSPPSRPLTIYSSPSANMLKSKRGRPKSTMLIPDEDGKVPIEKPWLSKRDPYARIAYTLTYAMMFLGVVASALKCFFDYRNVQLIDPKNLCLVLDEEFDSDQGVFGDNGTFFREVDMSGFGNGEFEMTTDSTNNSFVANGHLYIMPTLTSDSVPMSAILDGHVYNISDCTFNITQGESYTDSESSEQNPTGSSSSVIGADTPFDAEAYYKACSAVSNATTGTIINPVQSARLSTRRSASIKYGRVDVRAKIPTGDWMWPAIWMLPVDDTYGSWPLSGEIDIMEARGNGPSYPKQGSDYVRGSLNWGPLSWLNAVSKTYGWWKMKRGSYDQGFHTYSLEWTEDFIRIYVDTRLHHLLELRMNHESFWQRGDFPSVVQNGSQSIVLQNPWVNGTNAAPFDERFYLIMNVAVGGTNGWFPDGSGGKPWLDGSLTAMKDFLLAQDQWYPTWPQDLEQRAFVIDSVKMWQLCSAQ